MIQDMQYATKQFNLPVLSGLSEGQIKAHLGLYEGYVKSTNLIMEKLAAARGGQLDLDPYIVAELRRRFAFEFDGMRMHERYFAQFEEGRTSLSATSAFGRTATEKYGANCLEAHIREAAQTRGVGWVTVYADPDASAIHTVFVGDHEVGQLAGLPVLLALDLWEHAYMVDYVPAEKKSYIDAFFANLNWSVVEKRFDAAMKMSAA